MLLSGCSQYFPNEQNQKSHHGRFQIENVSTETGDFFCHRIFELTHEGQPEEKRTVNHLQFTDWPNYGVPKATAPIANFVQLVHHKAAQMKLNAQDEEPELVIHCSGGIGRSGAFLTSYGLFSHFNNVKDNKLEPAASSNNEMQAIDLTETVKELRGQRHPWMVEGFQQYEMTYRIILHLLNEIINA